MTASFYDETLALKDEIITLRRDLHAHPEIAFEEVRTAGIVAKTLTDLGLEVQTGVGKTGVIGLLEGDHDGPTILVRADMDALPILEANATDYISTSAGKMHACGHDGHTSMGLAVAKMLTARKSDIHGRIKFVFQPAEEVGRGARAMVSDGALDGPRPDYSVGIHLWNYLPIGTVAVTTGPFMAAADTWNAVITGHGGHGAIPHLTHDPIVAAAQIITALQSIVSRNINPLDAGVVTVSMVHGGDAFNVIPASVTLGGTIRSYLPKTQDVLHNRTREIVTSIATAMGCSAEIEITKNTHAVSNDPAFSDRVAELAARRVGAENVKRDERTMGAEDMSEFMQGIPGCYFFIGSANESRDLAYPHHNPRFDFDEQALVTGASLLAEAAASYVIPD